MTDFSEAALNRVIRQLEQDVHRRTGQLVQAVTLEGERYAKQQAVSGGSHPAGTPTPAVRGSTGPALISGNLRRNTVSQASGLKGQIGLARGGYYGKYLEDLGYRFISKVPAELIARIVPTQRRLILQRPWGPYT